MLRVPQIHYFFLTALTAQTAQTEEFLFQNVAYRLTVYRTGVEMLFEEAFIIIFMYQPFFEVSFLFLYSNYQWRRIIKGSNLSVENNSSWISKYLLKVAFFQKVRFVFQISKSPKKKIFQKTILSLKFKFHANYSVLVFF